MGALVSIAMYPLSLMATCCGSLAGSCAASMCCKACSCSCVTSSRVASMMYFGAVSLFVLLAMSLRYGGGDIVIGGTFNATKASAMSKAAHATTQGALDYWNNGMYCAPAHKGGLILCCANRCAGVFAVYRFSFTLCIFFTFLMLCTCGTTRFGAKVHRGFWFLKAFTLFAILFSTMFIENDAMETYREFARYGSFFFLVGQVYFLIDFGYTTNEKLVEKDEESGDADERFCNYKMWLLVGALGLYAISIFLWVLEAQLFGADGCAGQQFLISFTIIMNIGLSVLSITKYCPHGTLFTSSVVTAYTSYQCYSALASIPDKHCNLTDPANSQGADIGIGVVVFLVAMGTMAYSAYSATNAATGVVGKSNANAELAVTLDAGASSSDNPGAAEGEAEVPAESWSHYHLTMVIVSMYFAMMLSSWSQQPTDAGRDPASFSINIYSFWVKIVAQWFCLALYCWTLLAPYCFRETRDFGVEFDF